MQIEKEGAELDVVQLAENGWLLDNPAEIRLLEKVARVGTPLREFTGVAPLRGIKTGLNDAFLIDSDTRKQLLSEDPKCEEGDSRHHGILAGI